MNPIFKIPVHVLVFLYCICVLQHFVSIPYKSLMQANYLYYLLVDWYVIKAMFKHLKHSDGKTPKRNKFDSFILK